ncbi:hypothetical protein FHX10_003387 [Rhizobium sp. BK591]|uniref:hypothetical protein n=1 Tax=Rhizobium sp. BK591 TaxID=2586985 RepID=UPI00160AF5BF|nr:hypothetical protein [Rhizobium sp. BK591]MBB3743888.1 hypothetical protein [Rhizobium sp. BK591]
MLRNIHPKVIWAVLIADLSEREYSPGPGLVITANRAKRTLPKIQLLGPVLFVARVLRFRGAIGLRAILLADNSASLARRNSRRRVVFSARAAFWAEISARDSLLVVSALFSRA